MDARIRLTKFQSSILNSLLDSFESSSMTSLDQFRRRLPAVKPTVAIKNYYDPSCSIDQIDELHRDAELLEKYGDISLVWDEQHFTIKKIKLNIDHLDEIYRLIGRKKPDDTISEYVNIYKEFPVDEDNKIIKQYCSDQIAKLSDRKAPQKSINEIVVFLNALRAVLLNREETLERVFSMRLFNIQKLRDASAAIGIKSASKLFSSIKPGLVRVLERYGDYTEVLEQARTDTEKAHLILNRHSIVQNMTEVYVKGDGVLIFDNGDCINTHSEEPTPLFSNKLEHLIRVEIKATKVITIENETNFEVMTDKNAFLIYVSGYHKTGQNVLIQSIHRDNDHIVEWLHFGDLDPWGFDILTNLKKRSGIPFKPWKMGKEEYLDGCYANIRLPLTNKDLEKIDFMLAKGSEYSDMLQLMKSQGYKFEQEIFPSIQQ